MDLNQDPLTPEQVKEIRRKALTLDATAKAPRIAQALRYWKEHRPKMVARLQRQGILLDFAKVQHDKMFEQTRRLIQVESMPPSDAERIAGEHLLMTPESEDEHQTETPEGTLRGTQYTGTQDCSDALVTSSDPEDQSCYPTPDANLTDAAGTPLFPDLTAAATEQPSEATCETIDAAISETATADGDQMRASARLVKAALDHGILKFDEFVLFVADRLGNDIALHAAEGIELAWRTLKRLPNYSGIDDAGKVADVLGETASTNEDGIGARDESMCGMPGTSGGTLALETGLAEESELRKAAVKAIRKFRELQQPSAESNAVNSKEWQPVTQGLAPASGFPITDEMARAVAKRIALSIKIGVKSFEVLIRDLRRANIPAELIRGTKANLMRTWNVLAAKHGLDPATDIQFEAAMTDAEDADIEEAVSAAKGEPVAPRETPENVPGGRRQYSTQNAYSAAAREEMGLEQRLPVDRLPREPSTQQAAAYARTARGMEHISTLIQELVAHPRAVTPFENDLLLYRIVELGKKLDAALRKQINARKSGDSAQESLAQNHARHYRKEEQDLIKLVQEPIGREAARSRHDHQAIINQEFTLERLALEFEAEHRRPPTSDELAAMRKKIDDLNATEAELEKKLEENHAQNDDLETRLTEAHNAAVEKVRRATTTPMMPADKSWTEKAREKIGNAYKRLRAILKKGTTFSVEGAVGDEASKSNDLEARLSEAHENLVKKPTKAPPEAEVEYPEVSLLIESVVQNSLESLGYKPDGASLAFLARHPVLAGRIWRMLGDGGAANTVGRPVTEESKESCELLVHYVRDESFRSRFPCAGALMQYAVYLCDRSPEERFGCRHPKDELVADDNPT